MLRSIRGNKTFRTIAKCGRSVSSGLMVIKFLKRDDTGDCVCSCVASRKVGGAVVRNLVKRRIKAILRQLASDGMLSTSRFYLIICRPAIASVGFSALNADIRSLVRDIGRYGCNRL